MRASVAGWVALVVLIVVLMSSCRDPSAGDDRVPASLPAEEPTTSWALPDIDPCAILSRSVIEALAGAPVGQAGPGGATVDGSACQYTGAGPYVITLGLISTNAYESLRIDFGGEPVPNTGSSALVDGPDRLGDVTLVARSKDAAVQVLISGKLPSSAGPARLALAGEIARRALERLR